MTLPFGVGDKVQKVKGYAWPGIVDAIFTVSAGPDAGKTRVVVCCTVPEVAGALHIYNPEQLHKVD